ncbi:ATP-binding cassette domain-containing protein [Oscillibacter sp. MSJ-2]|uniref:ATP-binding cassette domain-containing protein n=1 Tax=Dysosmobacter acutus TaxID=2841504 RepID=A0ABS6F6S0_9FIRM|nr:ECF transporter S component [Dysosmobacter acutus]MBU5625983.1 ATP-binding cassette domain-containing protein [Dysosmobacter acutus]
MPRPGLSGAKGGTDLVTLEHLNFTYPGSAAPALRDVSLTVAPGEFITLCGLSGSGKTTLLRCLKPSLTPAGVLTGKRLLAGQASLSLREDSALIGFVGQSPENGTVTDKVWHELAFGLENLGLPTGEIRSRVAETASFFGIQHWFHREVASLSGGQKQLLSLASAVVMQPELLLLDEPTAQLDPVASAHFLEALSRLNRELGTAILLSEHHLEESVPLSGRLLALEGGRVIADGTPREAGAALRALRHPLCAALPAPMRLWAGLDSPLPCPVTIAEGRSFLLKTPHGLPLPPERPRPETTPLLRVEEAWFRYERESADVLRGLSLTVGRGECLAVVGGNGGGKSTLLRMLCGQLQPQRGAVRRCAPASAGLLPQDPQLLFTAKTVEADLRAAAAELSEPDARVDEVVELCGLRHLLCRHPYDLSGGEQQRAALAKVLLRRPELLLLDEPTHGLDESFRGSLRAILERLGSQGVTVVLASHDIDFCVRCAHRCVFLFDGSAVSEGTPRRLFSANATYTTAAGRLARSIVPGALLPEELIAVCGGKEDPPLPPPLPPQAVEAPAGPPPKAAKKRPLHPAAYLTFLLLIPATVAAGVFLLEDRKYYFISLAVILESMFPFFFAMERRRPRAREILLLSVLCALGVVGRAALYMLPQVKPVAALCVVAGACFGPESGFLVGALTMFASNLFFGQGPWTPWQMFSFGLAGFLAGLLFRGRPKHRLALCVYGAFAALAVCGLLLDTGSALMWLAQPSWGALCSYYLTGLPFNLLHAGATALFLYFFADPVVEKLERVKVKYGILSS